LTSTGCSLSFNDRPYECKTLEPIATMDCSIGANALDKTEIIKEWLPYQSLITLVINKKRKTLNEEA